MFYHCRPYTKLYVVVRVKIFTKFSRINKKSHGKLISIYLFLEIKYYLLLLLFQSVQIMIIIIIIFYYIFSLASVTYIRTQRHDTPAMGLHLQLYYIFLPAVLFLLYLFVNLLNLSFHILYEILTILLF